MTVQPMTHKSSQVSVSQGSILLETSTNNGVKCDWRGNSKTYDRYRSDLDMSWDIDWSYLKSRGVERLSGHITVISTQSYFTAKKVDVDMTESIQKVETTFETESHGSTFEVTFEYSLIPHRCPIKDAYYDELFQPSKKNDTTLVIDGKKLHVNKAFLSYHSDFFSALFSSNFKEGQMDEIPIKDITYEEFGVLMSTIYPKTQYPNDQTVEKLLELADRFMIPAAMGHVEHHLLHHSNINNEKKIWMADTYKIPKLLEKCIKGGLRKMGKLFRIVPAILYFH